MAYTSTRGSKNINPLLPILRNDLAGFHIPSERIEILEDWVYELGFQDPSGVHPDATDEHAAHAQKVAARLIKVNAYG